MTNFSNGLLFTKSDDVGTAGHSWKLISKQCLIQYLWISFQTRHLSMDYDAVMTFPWRRYYASEKILKRDPKQSQLNFMVPKSSCTAGPQIEKESDAKTRAPDDVTASASSWTTTSQTQRKQLDHWLRIWPWLYFENTNRNEKYFSLVWLSLGRF